MSALLSSLHIACGAVCTEGSALQCLEPEHELSGADRLAWVSFWSCCRTKTKKCFHTISKIYLVYSWTGMQFEWINFRLRIAKENLTLEPGHAIWARNDESKAIIRDRKNSRFTWTARIIGPDRAQSSACSAAVNLQWLQTRICRVHWEQVICRIRQLISLRSCRRYAACSSRLDDYMFAELKLGRRGLVREKW